MPDRPPFGDPDYTCPPSEFDPAPGSGHETPLQRVNKLAIRTKDDGFVTPTDDPPPTYGNG